MRKSRSDELFLTRIPPLKALLYYILHSFVLIPHPTKPTFGTLYHILNVLICLPLTGHLFPLQASIPVYANKWFYVMGDFSRKTGLQVYCDGELVDGDVLGTNGNHVKSDNPQNFFVGSSVNQGAHARFQLASISTFKGALSPKTISHIYSYFWRQGR